MAVHSYLFFEGRCEEALEFYRQALGAEVNMLSRYGDSPDQSHVPPGGKDKVMHASFRIGDTELMASDGMCTGQPKFAGFSLSIMAPDVESAERTFAALADGGTVQMPLVETFWTPRFGMVADKFGLGWMVNVVHKHG